MKPIEFPERNDHIDLPPGAPVPRVPVHRNAGQIITCWSLTPQELMEIQNTGVVYLTVTGSPMPNMLISGHYPFEPVQN